MCRLALFGGDKRIRTAGLLVANEALYQLSHIPKNAFYYIAFFGFCQQFFIKKLAFFIKLHYNKTVWE